MKFIFTVLLCFALLSNSLSFAAAGESPHFQAVIAAPISVNLSQTRAVPLSLCVDFRATNETGHPPLPARVKLWTTEGCFVVDALLHPEINGYTTVIDTPRTPANITLMLHRSGYISSAKQVEVEVTITEVNNEVLGRATIELSRAAKMEFIQVTQKIVADGKASGTIELSVTDEKARPIIGLPFLLTGQSDADDKRIIVAATTSSEGRLSFALPASPHSGVRLFQISDGFTIVTKQFEIHYENEDFHDQPFATPDAQWWKTPVTLFKPQAP